ncbi:MAG: GxxExxY protein [Candidatus Paceibacterota bacterium]
MFKLNTSLSEIHGIGPKFLERLKKLEIESVEDLLRHFPFRYEDFSRIYNIAELKAGQQATIKGIITNVSLRRSWQRRMFLVEALISDETGSVKAIWFNQPYLKNVLRKGKIANFAGKVSLSKKKLCLSNPAYEFINDGDETAETKHTGRLVPIYPETKGLTSKGIRYLIKPVLENLEEITDFLPTSALKNNNLPEINAALQKIHFPETPKEAQEAKKRFAFEDLFCLQLSNILQRLKLNREKAVPLKIDLDWVKTIIGRLPFELTLTQKKSLWEIIQDLEKPHPMNRLLQGDVGSGKTIVAALSALATAEEDKQSVFMAPTEILARQHYQTFIKFFPEFSKGLALITSAQAKVFYGDGLETEIKKSELLKEIASGKIKIVIGTHALIQKGVIFSNLVFVVIDEQHRFGVNQRKTLVRGMNAEQTRNNTEDKEIDDKLLYEDLTYKIRTALFDVKKELGGGHKESIYQKAVAEAFKKSELEFSCEVRIPIFYRNKKVGIYIPDFVVENKVIVELKALSFVGTTEKKQIWSYLRGSDYRIALLVNYGPKGLTIDRIIYDKARDSAFVPQSSASVPHFLSMSATPIPRTLSLSIFGDLDLSTITELPKNRKAIITKIVAPENRTKAYAFIRGQVKKGRQVFVICPRIEIPAEEETPKTGSSWRNRAFQNLEVKAVKEEYEKLKNRIFPDLKVAMLHGKLKAKEKESAMKKFKEGETDILVSTSVVEVGVDIPNAVIMMIEGAERFGLAQLYQFRGRVGRSEHQSFCFLFTDSSSGTTQQRLESIVEAKNGLELAEKDLEIRGPGEFLGQSQTGVPDLAMKAIQNPDLVKNSREAAMKIIQENPKLNAYPLLKEKIKKFSKEVHLE